MAKELKRPLVFDDKTVQSLANVMHVLRLPERIRILEIIATEKKGQQTSTRIIADQLGISPSNVSHHLKELALVGLITRKRVHDTTMVGSEGAPLRSIIRALLLLCRTGGWIKEDNENAAK